MIYLLIHDRHTALYTVRPTIITRASCGTAGRRPVWSPARSSRKANSRRHAGHDDTVLSHPQTAEAALGQNIWEGAGPCPPSFPLKIELSLLCH